MTFLRVNTELIAAGASKIQNALDDIDSVLHLLNNDVNSMLSAWSGDAAEAHRSLHDGFAEDAKTIVTSLVLMRDALLRTHSIYTNQETQQSGDHTVMTSQILS